MVTIVDFSSSALTTSVCDIIPHAATVRVRRLVEVEMIRMMISYLCPSERLDERNMLSKWCVLMIMIGSR